MFYNFNNLIFLKTKSTTTTTSPTSTPKLTTRPDNVIDFGHNSGGDTTDYIDMAMDFMGVWTKKFSEFYSTMNNLQMFYTILGVLNLLVTGLYSLLALPYLAALIKSVVRLGFKLIELVCCWRLCCAHRMSKKKRVNSNNNGNDQVPMRFKRLRMNDDNDDDGWVDINNDEDETQMLNSRNGGGGGLFKYRIQNDHEYDDEDDDFLSSESRDYLAQRNFLRVGSFWSSLSLFFLYGSLLSNFLLFMNSYLISRLSASHYNQVEIVNK